MKKLVVSDFDGTLARSDKTVSQVTRNVIARYRAKGGIFTIATGRMTEGILSQLEKAGLGGIDLPVVSYQGAHISTALSRTPIFDAFLETDTAVAVAETCAEQGLFIQTYGEGKVVVETWNEDVERYCSINEVSYTIVPSVRVYVATHRVYKILAWIRPERMAETKEKFAQKFDSRCQVIRSSPVFLEFFDHSAGKGNALKILARYFGVDMSDTMAFGDQDNDVDMVRAAAVGVAMQNATAELKNVADRVAPDCDHDGVAVVLSLENNLPMER